MQSVNERERKGPRKFKDDRKINRIGKSKREKYRSENQDTVLMEVKQ